MKVAAILGAELEEALKRVKYTLEKIDPEVLILSCIEIAKDMEAYARKLGYKGKIIRDEEGGSTYENARNIRKILKELPGNKEVYICTTSYHIPSASLIFRSYLNSQPFKMVSLPSTAPTKKILRNVGIEILSIMQDLTSLYACRISERNDIYEKTLKRIKNFLVEKLFSPKSNY